jgi:two-component system sensor histidine kinase YesM
MLIGQRKMSLEILHIKTSVYEEQISFLQSQINPHFLYNCLESIRGMASREMVGAVREMVSRIAMIYRYCS